jgi:PKD repeat protein
MMSLKRVSLFIFTLTIFFLIVPAVQATDFASLKNEYIQNHPGQAIIPFPWEPSTSIKILPFNYEIPAAPANTISMTATRNEFEAASFILTAQKDLSGITISVPNLYDIQGNTIPSSAIDVRLVKVWYQASPGPIEYTSTGSNPLYPAVGYYLTPELLLKDDSLVKVDYVTKTNYLRATINGVQQYIDISTPTATVPTTAQVRDATTLQPFSLKANENKQIWITVHVPSTSPAGDYAGTITINAPSETPVTMNFTVTVLPFDLEPAPVEYGIYYMQDYNPSLTGSGFANTDRTPANMLIELQDMKDHGILYPTFYQHSNNNATINAALTQRDTIGFPKDKIYTWSTPGSQWGYIGNAQDAAGLATIANNVVKYRNLTQTHGYCATYFYGIDEAKGSQLSSQLPAWQTVHNNGGKMWASVSAGAADLVGSSLDVAVLYGAPIWDGTEFKITEIPKWHSNGKKVFSYADPQAGVENPEIYRKNYGTELWNDGYDGAMDFAYQMVFGQSIWNDYDDPGWVEGGLTYHYRDHTFVYPTSNGVIDTIQWEGFREGVDDTRYVATLIKKDGNTVSAKAIVSAGFSNNENMTTIRKKMIDQILTPQANRTPVANFTGKPLTGTAPLTATFTDTSTNSPTSWNWSFGDGSLVNATVRNPVHTYTAAGNYTVILNATNAAGSTSTTRINYITVTAAPVVVPSPTPSLPLSPLAVIAGLFISAGIIHTLSGKNRK